MKDLKAYGLSDDQVACFESKGGIASRKYVKSEDKTILNHIIEKQGQARVGQKSLWIQMEKDRVLGGRSWKSMKHRFERTILKSLSSYNLTDEQISSFKTMKEGKDLDDNNTHMILEEEQEVKLDEDQHDDEDDEEEPGAAFIIVDF